MPPARARPIRRLNDDTSFTLRTSTRDDVLIESELSQWPLHDDSTINIVISISIISISVDFYCNIQRRRTGLASTHAALRLIELSRD